LKSSPDFTVAQVSASIANVDARQPAARNFCPPAGHTNTAMVRIETA